MSDLKVLELLEGITPGEWVALPTEYGWRVGFPRPGNEARIDSLTSIGLPEAEANGALMAAAPEIAREHASLTLEVAQLKQRVAESEAVK